MRTRLRSCTGFTLVELLVTAGVVGIISLVLIAYTSTSMRLIIRNLATNHSHDNIRVSTQRMLSDLHEAGSRFVLVNFDGSNYTDTASAASSDVDTMTGKYISNRTNGVRFYDFAGGPYKLTQNAAASDTDLSFDFGVGGNLPYVPQAGDRFTLPLIAREYQITSVITAPTTGNTVGKIRCDANPGIGFQLSVGTGKMTTACFYRKAAYVVWNQELRFYPNFEGANRSTYRLVRSDITSPKPFGLLFDTSSSLISDQLKLRISMECSDQRYSAHRLPDSTATLQAVIPPRNVPPSLTNTN